MLFQKSINPQTEVLSGLLSRGAKHPKDPGDSAPVNIFDQRRAANIQQRLAAEAEAPAILHQSRMHQALLQIPHSEADTILPAAQRRVAAIATEADAMQAGNVTGQALANLRTRLNQATSRVEQTQARHQEAEQRHFDSLSGTDDVALAESRAMVLELHSQLEILVRERDTLRRLTSEAEQKSDAERRSVLDTARRAVLSTATAEQTAALDRLVALLATPKVQADLRTLAETALIIGAINGDSIHRYERNVDMFVHGGEFLP